MKEMTPTPLATPRTNAMADRFGDIDPDSPYWEALKLATDLESELAERNEQLRQSCDEYRAEHGGCCASGMVSESTESKLTKPAQVGGTIFHAGIDERTVVERAQREYVYQQTPEREAARIARAKEAMAAISGAAPMVPTEGSQSASPSAAAALTERDRCPCGAIWTDVMFAYDGPHCAQDAERFKNAAPQAPVGDGSGTPTSALQPAVAALRDLVSLLLQTRTPIGPMRDRGDYPVELQRAIDFLHGRGSPSANTERSK